jgi:hypothetical protein
MSQETSPPAPTNKNPLFGRRWARNSVHDSYVTAAKTKEKILATSEDLAVKISRIADNRFAVKSRSTVVAKPTQKKAGNDKPTAKTRAQRKKAKADKHKARQENG